DTTTMSGSRIASSARSSRFCASAVAAAAEGGGGGTRTPSTGLASGMGMHPFDLGHGLGAIGHVELAEDALHVVLHGEFADVEDHPDLRVGLAHRDPHHDLALALGQDRH